MKFYSINAPEPAELAFYIALHNNTLIICAWLREKGYINDEIINHTFVQGIKKNNLPTVKFAIDYGADINQKID